MAVAMILSAVLAAQSAQLANIPDGTDQADAAYEQLAAGDTATAISHLEQALSKTPGDPALLINLGTAYDKLDRFDDVVRAMETAIKLDPHHADALNYLGYSYADRGIKIDQALSLTKQAVALKPDNGYYVDSLGWAFFKSGQLAEALVELKRAAALVGDDPVIYEHLGDIYAKQQRLSDAREAWLHALELDPTNHKLMDRFREQGMGDPAQEERIRRVSLANDRIRVFVGRLLSHNRKFW